MIKIEKVECWGFEHAIRGMRNPMNSWENSDSEFCYKGRTALIGESDLDLMKRLYKAGTEHRKFMRQIAVSMDITAPLYWWKEMDQYRIGVTTNSCSTMHKIHAKQFEMSDFSTDHLGTFEREVIMSDVINALNANRELYLEEKCKVYWWKLIQLLPSSYNQKRTLTMNYENVATIINQRSGHKLDEWNTLVAELKKLPYITEIMGD